MCIPSLFSIRFLAFAALAILAVDAHAQIAGSEVPGDPVYRANGMTDQPFTVEVLGVRRTVSNSLLVRLALTNNGSSPLSIRHEFSGSSNPAEERKISAIYAVDPNGQKKYGVLPDAQGQTLCSRLDPDLLPRERRELFAQLSSPPDTSSAVNIFFPRATAILQVPIGLPGAGEPLPPNATIGNTGNYPAPAAPVPIAPTSAIDETTTNVLPNVYATVPGRLAADTPSKALGNIQSGNSTTPFTVEALGIKRTGGTGSNTVLQLTLTNNGSNALDAAGQFTSGLTDLGDPRAITGVYLIDPQTQVRYGVMRASQTGASCSSISPPVNTGERRRLEAQFPALPAATKSVSVYFPHASPINDVPVE